MISGKTARNLIRNYCWKRSRLGRSRLKKIFEKLLPPRQQVELMPGLQMELDLARSTQRFLFWFHEEMESALQWVIRNLLPIQGAFIDCGANTGYMGLLASATREAASLMIEPHPRLREAIRKNIALSNLESKARVFGFAASDVSEEKTLWLNDQNDGSHSLEHRTGKSVAVQSRRLDEFLKAERIDHLDLLKVDAEGHDLQALQGLGDFLDPKVAPLIYIEMGSQFPAIARLLRSRGYAGFMSKKYYIDQLRKLKDPGAAEFFSKAPASAPAGVDWLWASEEIAKDALKKC